jgi:hypothetical protein
MRSFSRTKAYLLAECENCGRVLRFPNGAFVKSRDGYTLSREMTCPCGEINREVSEKTLPSAAVPTTGRKANQVVAMLLNSRSDRPSAQWLLRGVQGQSDEVKAEAEKLHRAVRSAAVQRAIRADRRVSIINWILGFAWSVFYFITYALWQNLLFPEGLAYVSGWLFYAALTLSIVALGGGLPFSISLLGSSPPIKNLVSRLGGAPETWWELAQTHGEAAEILRRQLPHTDPTIR